MSEHQPYLSPLSEQELYDLWMDLKKKWPLLYEEYCNPDYDHPNWEDKLRSVNGGISIFIHEHYPEVNFYPERVNILRDMIHFHDRHYNNGDLDWKSV